MLKVRTLAVSAALAAAAAPAAAQTGIEPDLQCLAATTMISGAEDQNARQAGTFGTLYFVGKLLGADPDLDLEAQLRAAAGAMQEDELQSVLQRCLGELQSTGQRLSAIGQAMSEEAQAGAEE